MALFMNQCRINGKEYLKKKQLYPCCTFIGIHNLAGSMLTLLYFLYNLKKSGPGY